MYISLEQPRQILTGDVSLPKFSSSAVWPAATHLSYHEQHQISEFSKLVEYMEREVPHSIVESVKREVPHSSGSVALPTLEEQWVVLLRQLPLGCSICPSLEP